MKTSNRVICRNEVFIEGESIGQFEAFTMNADHRSFGATAVLTLPLYAIGLTDTKGNAKARVRSKINAKHIKVCAEIEVYCWYDGYDRVKVFHGFVEHVAEGFPAKLYLRDASMILRFGTIQTAWIDDATLQQIVGDCVEIAKEGFQNARKELGFTRNVPSLKYSVDGNKTNNVQSVTTPLSFDNFALGRAPFEVIQYLMTLLVLYAGVDNENNLYIGAGVQDSTRPTIKLDTRYNVIERDITPVDGRFVDYEVKITGILKNGKRYTATGGLATTKSPTSDSELTRQHGETFRGFSLLNTIDGLQDHANRMLNSLKGTRNKGTITTLLYPKTQLLDHVDYNDTVFNINDAKYYVIGYSFSASVKGFYQKLTVTDQVFLL